MIIEEKSGNRVSGFYRGIVKKHLTHGRCKIYIPSVYSQKYEENPDKLPTAEQASPLFAGVNAGNGCFSYPNIGSIVWCFFENDDANYPVYFAATLGGKNAFGQYDTIKKNATTVNGEEQEIEEISKKHLITSGKTHVEMFEKGILSAVVENPIRLDCKVKCTDYEKSLNNIELDNSNTITNDTTKKIAEKQLSNIQCKIVLNNDADQKGLIQEKTHYFEPINIIDISANYAKVGQYELDNQYQMNNEGKIKFDTESNLLTTEINMSANIIDAEIKKTENDYTINTPGKIKEHIYLTSILNHTDLSNETTEFTTTLADSNRIANLSTNIEFESYKTDIYNLLDIKLRQTKNTYHNIHNNFGFSDNGNYSQYSKYDEYILSADKEKYQIYFKNRNIDSKFNVHPKSTSQLYTLSNYNLLDLTSGILYSSKLENKDSMDKNGKFEYESSKRIFDLNLINGILEILKTHAKQKMNVEGSQSSDLKYYRYQNLKDLYITYTNNKLKRKDNIKDKAESTTTIKSKKIINLRKIIDSKYTNNINVTKSFINTSIKDNCAGTECIWQANARNGFIEIKIANNLPGLANAAIRLNRSGTVQIIAPNGLDIIGNTTITGDTTIIGNTNIFGYLHSSGHIMSNFMF